MRDQERATLLAFKLCTDCIVVFLFLIHVINGAGGASTPTEPCPQDWHHYIRGGKCFLMTYDWFPWNSARDFCKGEGGDLLVIEDAHTHIFIHGLMNQMVDPHWFGLNDRLVEGQFRFLDDPTPAKYLWWAVAEPSTWKDAYCVYITYTGTRGWKNSPCDNPLPCICQMEARTDDTNAIVLPRPSKLCPIGWHHFEERESCFLLKDLESDFDTARSHCSDYGGHLAVIKDTETNIFVTDILRNRNGSYWFGLTLSTSDHRYRWVDDNSETTTYDWWGLHEPDHMIEDECIAMDSAYDFKWNNEVCSEPKPFICQTRAYDKGTVIQTLGTSGEPCPDGWQHDKDGRSCYVTSANRVTWQDARAYCQLSGGDLAVIKDIDSHIFVNYLLSEENQKYWIGLHDQTSDSDFYWLNDTVKATYFWWGTGEPTNNASSNQDCVYINPDLHLGWKDSPCETELYFLCQRSELPNYTRPVTSIDETCDDGWHLYKDGKTCFFLSTEEADWSTSRVKCQESGGDLAVIQDPGTLVFFNGLVSQQPKEYWLGLHGHGGEGLFQWLDNDTSQTSYVYWRPGEPNNVNKEDCAYVFPVGDFRWSDAPCSGDSLHFSCQKPASMATGATEVPSSTDYSTNPSPGSRCPSGWHHYPTTDSCYHISQTRRTWYDSRARCQLMHGDLAIVKNYDTQAFLQNIMHTQPGPYWIGLHDDHREGDFYWLDQGTQARYTNWSPGEPNDIDDEDCAYISPGTYGWNDANCFVELFYTCEMEGSATVTDGAPTTVTDTCPTGWNHYELGATCFGFFDRKVTWFGARTFCRHYGGDLAAIKNSDTQTYINALMKQKGGSYWIGLHDIGLEGVFHWRDEISKASYFSWAHNQPDNKDNKEDCVAILNVYGYAKWTDEPCYTNSRFLCQTAAYQDGVIPSTQPTIPTPRPSEPCLPGWTFHEKAQVCYTLSSIGAQWSTANTYCAALGGHLAVIKNADAQIVINYMIAQNRANYWIGLHDQHDEGNFVWLDETQRASYFFWKPYEPNNVGNEDCVFITAGLGWQDGQCQSEMLFVCETQAAQVPAVSTPIPGSCPEGWHFYPKGKTCYGLFTGQKTWQEARTECQKYKNGDLAVTKDPQTHIYVNDILKGKPQSYWLGLHQQSGGAFTWIGDDEAIVPWWWNSDLTNHNEGSVCVHTRGSWPLRWYGSSCLYHMSYVCQASPSTTKTAPTSTESSPGTTVTIVSSSSQQPQSNISGQGRPGHLKQAGSAAISSGAVVGIVIAVLVVVVVVAAAVFILLRRRDSSLSFSSMESSSAGFENALYDNSSEANLTFPK